MRLCTLRAVCLAAGLAAAPCAFAQTYANLTSGTVGNPGTVSGTLGSATLTYTGEVYGLQTSGGQDFGFSGLSFTVSDQNPWLPTSPTYTSATVTSAPSDGALIAVSQPATDSVAFSTPISGLIMDVFSLGSDSQDVSYTFNQEFEVLSCGPNAYFGGGCFAQGVGSIGDTLSGSEANGLIEFFGNVSDLTITVNNPEKFSGFDFGETTALPTPTPEPSSLILLGSGLLAGAGVLRRRLARR